jgi:hypothetical protein
MNKMGLPKIFFYSWMVILFIIIIVFVLLLVFSKPVAVSDRTADQKELTTKFQTFGSFVNVGALDTDSQDIKDKFNFQLYEISGKTNTVTLEFTPNTFSLDTPDFFDKLTGKDTTSNTCYFPDQVIVKRIREKCDAPECPDGITQDDFRERYELALDTDFSPCNPDTIYGPIVLGDDGKKCLSVDTNNIITATCDISKPEQLWVMKNRTDLKGQPDPNGPLTIIQRRDDGLTGCLSVIKDIGDNPKVVLQPCVGMTANWMISPQITIPINVGKATNISFGSATVPRQMIYFDNIKDLTDLQTSLTPPAGGVFTVANLTAKLANITLQSLDATKIISPVFVSIPPFTNPDKSARPYDYRLYNFIRENPDKFPI